VSGFQKIQDMKKTAVVNLILNVKQRDIGIVYIEIKKGKSIWLDEVR